MRRRGDAVGLHPTQIDEDALLVVTAGAGRGDQPCGPLAKTMSRHCRGPCRRRGARSGALTSAYAAPVGDRGDRRPSPEPTLAIRAGQVRDGLAAGTGQFILAEVDPTGLDVAVQVRGEEEHRSAGDDEVEEDAAEVRHEDVGHAEHEVRGNVVRHQDRAQLPGCVRATSWTCWCTLSRTTWSLGRSACSWATCAAEAVGVVLGRVERAALPRGCVEHERCCPPGCASPWTRKRARRPRRVPARRATAGPCAGCPPR